jgi:hypothetical protein
MVRFGPLFLSKGVQFKMYLRSTNAPHFDDLRLEAFSVWDSEGSPDWLYVRVKGVNRPGISWVAGHWRTLPPVI